MNVFNRLVVIVLLIVSMIVLPVALVLVPARPDIVIVIGQQSLTWLTAIGGQLQLRFILAGALSAVLTFVVCGLLLWLELRRPHRKAVRVQKVSGGEAKVTTDSIARRLAYNIDQLAEVISVKPKVMARGKGVHVRLNVETGPEIDVPAKTEEISKVAREVIEERMGLKLAGKLEISIKHMPYPKDWSVVKKAPAPDSGHEEFIPLE
ncbi:MAG: alkaline shock response membrane anchor protein AmaP [Anaerolineae bacterium]|nr:alkaline shock response membrane anchor protein AmaP [Anaerolineae bacterium]